MAPSGENHPNLPPDALGSEKARYRKKLAEWKQMGFDVSALEVLLETDFEKFKEKRFELMRQQIRGARPSGPETAAPPPSPAIPAGTERREPATPAAPALQRRPGLHTHFMRPPLLAGPTPAAPEKPALQERIQSEMRYPAARRRTPGKKVRTFSVEAEPEQKVGVIFVGGAGAAESRTGPPGAKRPPKKARTVLAQASKAREGDAGEEGQSEMAVDEAERAETEEEPEMAVEEEEAGMTGAEPAPEPEEDEPEMAVEEESEEPASPEEEAAGEEEEAPAEKGKGEEEKGRAAKRVRGEAREEAALERGRGGEGEEEAEEEEEEEAEQGPAPEEGREGPEGGEEEEAPTARSRPPVRKRALKKVAVKGRVASGRPGPKRSYGWLAIAVVLVIILAFAGYWFVANPTAKPTARASFPRTAAAGETVQFDGGNSTAGSGRIVKYEWKFGDGAGAIGRTAAHFYTAASNYTVELTVVNADGARSAPSRSRILVTPLMLTVPPKHIGDRASYGVSGEGYVSNNDTYLYSFNLAGAEVHVIAVDLKVTGTLGQWVRDNVTAEDGFGASHDALRTRSEESLSLAGSNVTTNLGTYRVSYGSLNYTEDSCADPSTSSVFKVVSRADTSLTLQVGISGHNSIDSTDSLRSYPSLAAMSGQFLPENIYKGHRFDQAAGNQTGSYRSGNVTYSWTLNGIQNIGGYASLGLRITADQAFLDRYSLKEFYMDLWVSGCCSLPTGTHVHLAGKSGDNSFFSDYDTMMTSFRAGTDDIPTAPQTFDPNPLPRALFSPSFSDVPQPGGGNTSLRFSPGEAREAALSKDATFSSFISNNSQAYAVAGKYFEGLYGPGTATWNLTFGWPGASTAYFVNVTLTRDPLDKYSVRGAYLASPPQVTTAESSLSDSGMLTLSSAEGLLRDNDTDTNQTFFANGSVQWGAGVSLSLQADALYPNINLASMYGSGDRAGYAMLLQKDGYTSALSMDTGQFMYYYTHSAY
jgi:PKD repeat protein